MSLYRIEMDEFGVISIFRLRHAPEPKTEHFVYGMQGGLVTKPPNDFRDTFDTRPLDTWFEGTENRSMCYTRNSVLIALIREFKRRSAKARRHERRERQIDLTREMQRLLKEVLTTSRAHT